MPKLTLKDLESKIDQDGCLDLSMSKLTSLTCLSKLKNSKKLHKITKIDLSDNYLELNFNDSSQPENKLTIHNDKLLAQCPIPEILHQKVTSINLANNKITRLPSYFGFFKNLQKLDLYQNNIGSKESLEEFSLKNSLPEGPALGSLNLDVFGSLTKLKWLDLTGNPIAVNEHQFSQFDAKMLQEIKKLINIHDSSITARNVANYCGEKFQTAAKRRIKNKKKAEKQGEKAAKALKLEQKEERRKAFHEKQEAERLEEIEKAGNNINENNDDQFTTDSENHEKSIEMAKNNEDNESRKDQILKAKNEDNGIISKITSSIFSLIMFFLKIGIVLFIGVIAMGMIGSGKKSS